MYDKRTQKYYNFILDDLNKTFNNKNNEIGTNASTLLNLTKTKIKDYLEELYGKKLEYLLDDEEIIIDILNDWFYGNYRDGNFPRVGERIVLVSMDDPYGIKPGTTGTIISYPQTVFDTDQVNVKWDNGRGLALIIDVDEFEKI
jgi:hypothetical protein